VDGEARQPLTDATKLAVGPREPVPDFRHASVQRAHRQQRIPQWIVLRRGRRRIPDRQRQSARGKARETADCTA
jgi:ribosomal protein L39E